MDRPVRKSPRLHHYDYSQNGTYFITICTQKQHCVLSRISVGEGLAPPALTLLPFGEIADQQLRSLSTRFPSVTVEKYVIMPNHIHILLTLRHAGGASPSPTIPAIIGAFKSLTTRACKINESLFQRSFHDHVVRTEQDYAMIWAYIDQNPLKWTVDRFYCSDPYTM